MKTEKDNHVTGFFGLMRPHDSVISPPMYVVQMTVSDAIRLHQLMFYIEKLAEARQIHLGRAEHVLTMRIHSATPEAPREP